MTIVVDNDPEMWTIDYIAFNKQLGGKKLWKENKKKIQQFLQRKNYG